MTPHQAVILSSPTRVPRVAVEMTAGTSADSIGLMNAVMRSERSESKDLRFVRSRLAGRGVMRRHSRRVRGCLFRGFGCAQRSMPDCPENRLGEPSRLLIECLKFPERTQENSPGWSPPRRTESWDRIPIIFKPRRGAGNDLHFHVFWVPHGSNCDCRQPKCRRGTDTRDSAHYATAEAIVEASVFTPRRSILPVPRTGSAST
jgi:hypothetical protein